MRHQRLHFRPVLAVQFSVPIVLFRQDFWWVIRRFVQRNFTKVNNVGWLDNFDFNDKKFIILADKPLLEWNLPCRYLLEMGIRPAWISYYE